MALNSDLLAELVCPACRGDLTYDAATPSLSCPACRLRYKIVDDIAVMLIDAAEKF